jgi:hypothetical protein
MNFPERFEIVSSVTVEPRVSGLFKSVKSPLVTVAEFLRISLHITPLCSATHCQSGPTLVYLRVT